MDYNKHYKNLIIKAKNRNLTGYVERHHIVPKCLGGTDADENIVILTAEEHYLAHLLLMKIYPNNGKLAYAVVVMTFKVNTDRGNNKLYGWVRKRHSELMRGKTTKVKGRVRSEEFKKKVSLGKLGKTNDYYGYRRSAEQCRAISIRTKGRNNPRAKYKPFSVFKEKDKIYTFNYVFECSDALNIDRSTIVKCLNNKLKSSSGYTFSYE